MNVKVRTSEAYAAFRATLRQLNHFVWSSEICYGYALAASDLQAARHRMVDDVLGQVEAQAWYPRAKRDSAGDPGEQNAEGKYRHTVEVFLDHVERDIHYVYLAAIVMVYTAFEEYLGSHWRSIDPKSPPTSKYPQGKEMENWGPYCWSLSGPSVYWEGAALKNPRRRPVRLKTVLKADVLRLLRNQIVHARQGLALSRDDSAVADWQKKLADQAKQAAWSARMRGTEERASQRDTEIGNIVRNAVDGLPGQRGAPGAASANHAR